ncbi:Transcriptional regulator [Sphingobium indicum BiD32]|uniref:Transcriptional regulator n=1 Tax=Sphingobium indicum BiD32 TaxID=1301087 RepID=N1MFV1_9SPHN|nr:TetR/AcrR family transcriptional regulator [Sphingobium indicum]CCW15841.1 Transcriptional regulator [Sphingobium indicum BiD32]
MPALAAITPAVPAERRGRKSRRDVIIIEAARIFFEKGFDRTSVRDIAASSGMTSGSIFYHFSSKEDLLAHVIAEGIRHGHEIAEHALIGKVTPIDRFRALIVGHLRVLHDQRHMHKVSIQEWDKLPPEARAELKEANNRYRIRWLDVLAGLEQGGYLKAEAELFRRTQIASLNWTVHYKDEELEDLENLADRMAATSLNMATEDFTALLDR